MYSDYQRWVFSGARFNINSIKTRHCIFPNDESFATSASSILFESTSSLFQAHSAQRTDTRCLQQLPISGKSPWLPGCLHERKGLRIVAKCFIRISSRASFSSAADRRFPSNYNDSGHTWMVQRRTRNAPAKHLFGQVRHLAETQCL